MAFNRKLILQRAADARAVAAVNAAPPPPGPWWSVDLGPGSSF